MTIASNSPGEADSEAKRALQIIESMPGHAWSADAAGRFTYVSPNTLAFLGNAREDLNTPDDEDEFGWRRVVHPLDYDRVAAKWRHCLETGDHYDTEHRLRRADGVYRWFRNSGRPSRDSQGRITQWYGTTMDIDDQKRAEAALRDRERELSLLVNMVPSHLWRLTPEGEPTFFNKQMVDFLGLDVADTDRPGINRLDAIMETVHPDDAAKFRDALHRCLITGESFAMRYRLRRADGVYRWMSSRAEPLRDQDGRIVQWYGLSSDIDDQMHAEEALAAAKRDLQLTIDTIPVYVATYRPDGTRDYVNRIWQDYVGLTTEQATGQSAQTFPHFHPEDVERNDKAWRASLASGKPMSIEVRVRRADGQYRWHASRRVPLRDEKGNIVHWYSVGIDIDDQKRAEAALRDRERELSQLVDMVPSHLWRLTPEGQPTFFNKRMVDFLGLDVADTDRPGISRLDAIMEIVHPDDAAKFRNALHRCLVTGESFAMRYRLRRADGVYRWMSSRAEPLRDQDGRIVQWYGLCHDIDDQVHAEEDLQKSERRYRDLFHYMPIGLTQVDASKLVPLFRDLRARGVTDLQKHIDEHPEFLPRALEALDVEEVNQHIIEMFGAKNAEEMRGPITRYWQPGLATIRRSIEARYRGEEVFQEETKVARMDGGVIDVLFTTARPGAVADKSLVGFIDITERKKAEEALRDREREFSLLVDMVPSLIWRLDPEGEPTFLSKRLRNFLGTAIADAEKPGMGRLAAIIEGAVHPDDADSLEEAFNHSFVTGERFSKRFRLRRADGVYRWVEGSAEPLRDESGCIVQWYGLSRDIDDQMRAEQALRESEAKFRAAIDGIAGLVAIMAPSGELESVNRPLTEYFGRSVDELKNWATGDAVHPEDLPRVLESYATALSAGTPFHHELRMRRFDGEYRWFENRGAPIRDESGRITRWYCLLTDIEDRTRALARLQQMQSDFAHMNRVSTMGELAASLSHEITQPISSARNNARAAQIFLDKERPDLGEVREALSCVVGDTDRAGDIIDRIREHMKKAPPRKECFDLNAAITEVIALTRSVTTGKAVSVQTRFANGLRLIEGDRVQLQQVILNLILNAVEAIEAVEMGQRDLLISTQQVGTEIVVAVRDTGPGIDPKQLERVFEPFYTTKPSGTGMGLSICRSIIDAHGGRLWAEPNEPCGAVFQFTLPGAQARS